MAKSLTLSHPDLQMAKLTCLQKLGGGTYGKVYSAVSETNEVCAVKRILIPLAYSGTAASVRELNILKSVRCHPFCLQLKEAHFGTPFSLFTNLTPNQHDTSTDRLYFIMEKGDMDGLRWLRDVKSNWIDRKTFGLHLALAIEFLHSRGIYHRDIKPANIICFLDKGLLKSAKLTDYGLSQYYTPQVLAPPDMVTLWYRAPEIALRKDYDLKVDVWSFGCILYELFSGNVFVRPESDEQLLNCLIPTLPFPREDYLLAKQLFGRDIISSFDQLQANILPMSQRIGMPEYEIASFNSSILGGRANSGKYKDLVSVIEKCLVVNPKNRYTISECLNSPFFGGYREMIDRTRTKFGINSYGEWVLKPALSLKYTSGNIRSIGMKWFRLIYSARTNYPINTWYSHRVMFHAIEMFDRFLNSTIVSAGEGDILVWVNTFLFLSAKFFRIMQANVGIDLFANGIPFEEKDLFQERAIQFEETILKDHFDGMIYEQTIYESFPEYLTEVAVNRLFEIIFKEEVKSGTSFEDIWVQYSPEITRLNCKVNPMIVPPLPIINIG